MLKLSLKNFNEVINLVTFLVSKKKKKRYDLINFKSGTQFYIRIK